MAMPLMVVGTLSIISALELYDMEKDKFEKNNIANEHPDLVAKLSKKVCKWFEENKDKGKE